jgi:hypothetical protein
MNREIKSFFLTESPSGQPMTQGPELTSTKIPQGFSNAIDYCAAQSQNSEDE